MKGIKREFSVPRTPQQNGIAKRKNRTLIEAARTMLADSLLPISFWAETTNTACYVQNRVLVTGPQNKTPYELLLGRTPSIGFMRPFDYPMTILNTLDPLDLTCLFEKATIDESNLWHRRLGHINYKTMNKLVKGNLVRGLPTKVLKMITLVLLVRKASNIEPLVRPSLSDNGTELKNNDLNQCCRMKGIKREFSVPRTPQQNGIAKRKNKTLIEAARTMLADLLLPISFWAEATNTACYVQNRVLVTGPQNKTPYELLLGRTPSIGFMRPFDYPMTILNTLDPLGKFNGKVDEGFLVGYSVSSKAFRVFNSRTRIVQETLHINFLENKPNVVGSGPTWLFDIDTLTRTMNYQPVTAGNQSNPSASVQEQFDAEKAGNTNGDAAFGGKEPEFEGRKPDSAQTKKHDDKTKKEAKGKSPVESST
nr:retrovirus-related Pol polyprotein from transposon TNT 1-94 [Tanacetum cinerariifolium]